MSRLAVVVLVVSFASASASVAVAQQVVGPDVQVSVTSDQPGLQLHRIAASATAVAYSGTRRLVATAVAFESLCTAPCQLRLTPQTYRLAVQQGGTPVAVEPVSISGDGTLHLDYVSRAGIRTAGWITFGVGVLAAVVPLTIALTANNDELDTGMIIAGAVAGGTLMLVGYILTLFGDIATADFRLGQF